MAAGLESLACRTDLLSDLEAAHAFASKGVKRQRQLLLEAIGAHDGCAEQLHLYDRASWLRGSTVYSLQAQVRPRYGDRGHEVCDRLGIYSRALLKMTQALAEVPHAKDPTYGNDFTTRGTLGMKDLLYHTGLHTYDLL